MSIKILNYLEIISSRYPGLKVICFDDPNVYSNLLSEDETPLPSKAELDNFILEEVKKAQIDFLSSECQKKITSGFISSALGSPHIYDSEEVDQLNLIGSVASTSPTDEFPEGLESQYAVRPIENEIIQPKIYKLHTYKQLREVMTDGSVFKLGCLLHFNEKRSIINNSCSTMEEVTSITWE